MWSYEQLIIFISYLKKQDKQKLTNIFQLTVECGINQILSFYLRAIDINTFLFIIIPISSLLLSFFICYHLNKIIINFCDENRVDKNIVSVMYWNLKMKT